MAKPVNNTVRLRVGSKLYEGWTAVSVRRSLETIAGAFTLTVTERWPSQQARAGIKVFDPCTVTIGADTVITGYVDDVGPEYDEGQHQVVVRGRDAAGQLVDCSILAGAVQLPTDTALGMIQKICRPFGIKVTADVPAAKNVVYNEAVQLSETAFEAISRIAEQSGILVVSDGKGGLLLTDAGTAGGRAGVILGKNILRARGLNTARGRYSYYLVAYQVMAGENVDPRSAASGNWTATDPGVPLYRPLVLMVDIASVGTAYAQQRANWEAAVRLGRSLSGEITVRGWRDDAGALWAPNTLVRVEDEFLAIDDTLLVSGVHHLIDDDYGEITELTVTRRQAFQPLPIPALPSFQGMGGGL